MRFALALLLGVVLAGCQLRPVRDEDSPYFNVPVGSQLILNQRLVITEDDDQMRFQGGAIAPHRWSNLRSKYEPNCVLYMRRGGDYNHIIQPDTFDIYRVVQVDHFERNRWPLYASRGTELAFGGIPTEFATILFLRSTRQPAVDKMACKHYQEAYGGKFLSISEMRQALGAIFSLKIAP